ncbi:MAG: DUF1731 domain-containing protein [Pseudomonadota bacterium]
MSIVVTGATGRIGRVVMRLLAQTGVPVHVLTRRFAEAEDLFAETATIHEWHPLTAPPPGAALKDAEVVLHLAGMPVTGRWSGARAAQIARSRIVSTGRLVSALKERRIRFVSASSFGIYPGVHGEEYPDDAELAAPVNAVQKMMQDWERTALDARRGGASVAIARFGMVCGPADRSQRPLFPHAIAAACARGRGLAFGDASARVPVIDVDDAARLAIFLASAPDIEGPVNVVAPTPITRGEINEAIKTACGRGPRVAVPNWMARAMLGPSASLTLGSYDVRAHRAMAAGFKFAMPDGRQVVAEALRNAASEAVDDRSERQAADRAVQA